MKKFLTIALTTAVLGTAVLSIPTTAQANGFGPGLATGLVGGAIIGGVIANQNRGPGYYDGPVYYEDGGYAHCHRVLFHDDYGHETWRRICH